MTYLPSTNFGELGQTLQALRVYLRRGQEALALSDRCFTVKANEEDQVVAELLAVLRRREEAFHNFCALEHISGCKGHDIKTSLEAQAIWQQLIEVNAALFEKLEAAKIKQKKTLGTLQKVRHGVAGYHSQQSAAAKFIKGI
jgi:hypothetical protein